MNVYLETMGCQMNRLDSELVEALLCAAGHRLVADRRRADLVLYNTCCVRRHAEDKVHSRLGADAQRKAAGRPLRVGVLGCMAQAHGRDLLRRHPCVDILCGPGQLPALAEMIQQAAAGQPAVRLDPARTDPPDLRAEQALEHMECARDLASAPRASHAYVRVMRGCDKFCAYCVVPQVRGPQRSRPPDAILQEVRRLVDAGRTHVTLLGQTVNAYAWRDGGATARFSDLLQRVSAVAGLHWLSFLTSHPLDFGDDVLEAMRDLPNVCPYIHCPAQSGSDAVLKRMNRRYSRAQYDELVDRARATVPGVVLAGDFIVGFPGETEADHAASGDLIRRSGYKNSFIFQYSPRGGTLAARRYADDVPPSVKRRRNNELLAVQDEVGRSHHRAYVARTLEVRVEGPSPRADKQTRPAPPGCTQLVGRTRGDHVVHFDGRLDLAGRYVQVTITDATALTLMGEPAG